MTTPSARTAAPVPSAQDAPPRELELAIARLLNIGAITSVLLLATGVVLAAAAGIDPITGTLPPFDLSQIVPDIVALQPEGFLWLGLVVVIATPASRVIASLIGFAAAREWLMASVSLAVLAGDRRRRRALGRRGLGRMDGVLLLIAFVVILIGAELFTNGIEWFGHKLQLAEGAVGSVLAAVGTALPETMIPIIAILFGTGGRLARGRDRRDPRCPVHARDARDVRHRGRCDRQAPAPPERQRDAGLDERPRARHALFRDRVRARGRRCLRAG